MSDHLCAACVVLVGPFLPQFTELARKLDDLTDTAQGRDPSRADELDRALEEAELVGRTFDRLLCDECRKLGPPFPF